MQKSNILLSIFIIIIVFLVGYILLTPRNEKNTSGNTVFVSLASTTSADNINSEQENKKTTSINGLKTFIFDNFHGSSNISPKFQLEYPANWQNDGQYFSPQKIEYYDQYSVRAPFYFDLIRADIFDQTDFKYQIDTDKRKSPDTHGTINFKEFKRYDLIDYGSYGGDSSGRVIIYVGPTIVIDGLEYHLVFHWEERPLTSIISGNDPAIFEKVLQSLKFIK